MATSIFTGKPFLIFLLVLLLSCLLIYHFSCKPTKNIQNQEPNNRFVSDISWNVLFKPGVDLTGKTKAIENIQEAVRNFYVGYNTANGTNFVPVFEPVEWCPCDSSLFNLNFYCVNGVGGSKTSSPKPPTPTPSGGLLDVLLISQNEPILSPKEQYPGGDSVVAYSVTVKNKPVDNSKILAIIDTGIDTALFQPAILNILWSDPTGQPTLYNFLPRKPLGDFSDPGKGRHGSAVATLALYAMKNAVSYPRLMILKALDEKEAGTSFSVNCAMSYAIQKNVSIINLSLGYYGEEDPIMKHYLKLAANHTPLPIEVFAAAGNTITGPPHNPGLICSSGINDNELTSLRLFYPACFTANNITSVTQVNNINANSSCFYQNYSNSLVTLGVQNTSICCAFRVEFKPMDDNFYEGSSFATPVASGTRMSTLLNTSTTTGATAAWNSLINTAPMPRVTVGGHYIKYTED